MRNDAAQQQQQYLALSSTAMVHPNAAGEQRTLEDYYAYDEPHAKQHPVYKALLLVILGTLVLASISYFIMRYFFGWCQLENDDHDNDNAATTKLNDGDDNVDPTTTTTTTTTTSLSTTPPWASPDEEKGYVNMAEKQGVPA